MLIKIYGCSDKALRDEIRNLSKLTLNKLINKRKMLANVTINVYVGHKDLEKENAWGLCWWTDKNEKPRKFAIAISNSLSSQSFKKILIHELIHVKQYLLGDMKDYVSGKVKWKKNVYEDGYIAQLDSPWEKEAYELSEILVKKIYT